MEAPVENRVTSREIYDELFERIVSGSVAGGHRLKEVEVSEQFGVSRTPVRDAFRLLEQDGLVKILPAQGAVVVPLTPDDIEDIYDIRMMLELLAIDLAGASLRLQRLSELRDQIATEQQDVERQVELDTGLHQYLIDATGRRYLASMYERTHRLMRRIRSLSFRDPHTLARATREHLQLIDALLVRDLETAKTVIRRHIQNSKIYVLSILHRDSARVPPPLPTKPLHGPRGVQTF
jgi:DNA-binding GntR family transcriptional regulator